MICEKCGFEFDEKELQLSHDIPKYIDGTDADGRHWLCKDCHDDYEFEVLKLCMMNYFKNIPDNKKKILRFSAKIVKGYFFKKRENDGLSKI